MSENQIEIGDSVVFSQRYQPGEIFAKLHNHQGIVRSIDAGETTANVEFYHEPGKTQMVLIDDLETLPSKDGISLEDCEPYNKIEETESHELGGMSKAQLITHKLYAQEYDPALDKSINKLIH